MNYPSELVEVFVEDDIGPPPKKRVLILVRRTRGIPVEGKSVIVEATANEPAADFLNRIADACRDLAKEIGG